jgi:competence protein ComEC
LNPTLSKPQTHIPFLSLNCLIFIAGIILANYIKINFIILYILSWVGICVLFYRIARHKSCSYIIILIFFLIGLLRQATSNTIKPDDISYLNKFSLNKVSLQGVVISPVQESRFGRSFIFRLNCIKIRDLQSKVSGKVFVRFNKRLAIDYGDLLTIRGRLVGIKDEGYFNKGLIRQAVASALVVARKDWITIDRPARFSIIRLAIEAKGKLKERLEAVPSPAKDFLIAFILGDRLGLDQDIYNAFKQTGTVHILAISGLHIGIIIFMLIVFLKMFRIKINSRFVIIVLFLLFYNFMTGLRPSIVRSVVMGIVFLLSFLVKREYHIYNSLALSAMIILFIWPWQIFDIGFQLSYLSVLAIVFISPKILRLLPKLKNRFLNYIEVALVISLSTWLVTTPLVAYYFGLVSVISLIANLFIIPFTPLILAGGFIYLLASFIAPFFTGWIALSLKFMIDLLIFLTIGFKSIPFAYFYMAKLNLWILLLYYLVIVLLFNIFNYVIKRE